jgi:hypothetical protein
MPHPPSSSAPVMVGEFSTGIVADGDRESWVSRGFTGQFMNSSIGQVPELVENAIANKLFVTTGGRDRPAMIGRILRGQTEKYAVVAVVTLAQDEMGRSVSLTRYFIASGGSNSLAKMVSWIEDITETREDDYFLFNPFRKELVNLDISVYRIPGLDREIRNLFWKEILWEGQDLLSLHETNMLMLLNAKNNDKEPVGWAWNVSNLAEPRRFDLIVPIDRKAADLFKQVLSEAAPKVIAVRDDQIDSKSILKGIINGNQLRPDLIQSLNENMRSISQAASADDANNYWHEVFDSQGAKNAIAKQIHSQQMVRLLTCRAHVLPSTVPQLLNWLRDEKSGDIQAAISYQKQLREILVAVQKQDLVEIKKAVYQSTLQIPLALFEGKITLNTAIWAFRESPLWGRIEATRYLVEVLKLVKKDPPRTGQCPEEHQDYEDIYKSFRNRWVYKSAISNPKLIELGQLFTTFEPGDAYIVAACCYEAGQGNVPSHLFRQIAHRRNKITITELNLSIHRKISAWEKIGSAIWDLAAVVMGGLCNLTKSIFWAIVGNLLISSILIVIIAAISAFLFLFGGLNYISSFLEQGGEIEQTTSSAVPQWDLQDKNSAEEAFQDSTSLAIRDLVLSGSEEPNTGQPIELTGGSIDQDTRTKLSKLKEVLGGDPLKARLQNCVIFDDYIALRCSGNRFEEFRAEWISAIYQYQTDNGWPADGIIDLNGRTYQQLKKELEEEPIVDSNLNQDIADDNADAIAAFESTTLTSISTLIRELSTSQKYRGKWQDEQNTASNYLKQTLKDVLGRDFQQGYLQNCAIPVGTLTPCPEGDLERYKSNWIDAIKKYQEANRLQADGIIDNPGDTFNRLKDDIEELLNDPPKDQRS